MLKEQLEELQKAKRTLLHTRNSMIKFIDDGDFDTATLFNALSCETSFTKPHSISFDRHQLSEREEAKFNKKFAPFLKQLVARMQDKDTDLLLEYLLRIYSMDTFNPNELLFLLLPFKKYFGQFLALSKNSRNQFSSLKTYSVQAISRILVRDRYLFLLYTEYFKNYPTVKEFLDKSLEEIIEMVKTSDFDYLSEFYQIMVYLIAQNEHGKALEIYHRMRSYLQSEDFEMLLKPFYSEDVIKMKDLDSIQKHPFETVYTNATGRSLLNDPVETMKYIEYLELVKDASPKEFNENEYKMLRVLFLGKSYKINSYSNLVELYKEVEPKTEFTKYLMKKGAIHGFYQYMDDESKILVIQESADDPHINLLTSSNHVSFIKNMKTELFDRHYSEILDKCLGFKTFEPSLFCTKNFGDWARKCGSDIVKANLIRLAQQSNHDLTEEFMKMDMADKIVLSYLLRSQYAYTSTFALLLYDTAKNSKDSALISDLASFLCRHPFNLNEFCGWACANNFAQNIEELVTFHKHVIDSELHYVFFTKTGSVASLEVLLDRNVEFVRRLYESNNFDCILRISNTYGADKVLIDHPAVFDFIAGFGDGLSSKDALIGYLLDNYNHERALEQLVRFLDLLICFRSHKSWRIIRIILLEGLSEKYQFQKALDYIVAHFDQFSDEDSSLFDRIFQSDAIFDLSSITSIISHQEPASFFLDSYLMHRDDDVLSMVPLLAPVLIKFKRESIVKLFEKYTNIMGTYSGSILREYPEVSDVLLCVDSRYVLREICNSFDDANVPLLIKVLETKETNSPDVVKRISEKFSECFGALIQPSHVVTFIRFYERSFGASPNESISSLLGLIYGTDKVFFYAVACETIGGHSCLFADIIPRVIYDIISAPSECDSLLFLLSQFLDHEYVEIDDAFRLYKKVFKLKSELSPALIRSVCKNDFCVGESILHHIVTMLQKHSEVSYCLDILMLIFKDVEEARSFKSEIIASVVIYTEDKDEAISSKSNELLEILHL